MSLVVSVLCLLVRAQVPCTCSCSCGLLHWNRRLTIPSIMVGSLHRLWSVFVVDVCGETCVVCACACGATVTSCRGTVCHIVRFLDASKWHIHMLLSRSVL